MKTIHEKNLELILALNPRQLWHFFANLSAIPRGSKNEKAVTEYLQKFADEYDLDIKVDKSGNVVIFVPATPGKENIPSVCLQAHVDMVCEKTSESTHDFTTDPIEFILVDESTKLKAKDTSLGADNGIGVAAMLTIAENPEVEHGPIELLFTVDEETGLNGASAIPKGFIRSKIVLNLDSEDWGEIYISAAGGMRTKIYLPLSNYYNGAPTVRITITGLKGGHSGVQINRPHENPIRILGRLIRKLYNNNSFVALTKIEGGEKFNVIPREAFAEFVVTHSKIPALKRIVTKFEKMIQEEIGSFEPEFKIIVETIKGSKNVQIIEDGDTQAICDFISLVPHGVIRMSSDIPDLVQTSNNLASVKTVKSGNVIFQTMQRGSINSEVKETVNCIDNLAERCDAHTTHSGWYSGWKANPDSAVLKLAEKVFLDLFKEDAKIKAIHAGLECGVLAGKYPGLDILSFGPTIRNPHSPDEYVEIETVEKFWNFLLAVLKNVS